MGKGEEKGRKGRGFDPPANKTNILIINIRQLKKKTYTDFTISCAALCCLTLKE